MTFVAVTEADEATRSASRQESEAADRRACAPYLGALFVQPDNRGKGLAGQGACGARGLAQRSSALSKRKRAGSVLPRDI